MPGYASLQVRGPWSCAGGCPRTCRRCTAAPPRGSPSTERALALAEADRLVLPFAMTGSRPLLEALPRHQTAHAALLTDILDLLRGSSAPAEARRSSPPAEELSPGELRVLRYLPTNLSRPQIASELSVSGAQAVAATPYVHANVCVC
jgi:hypothetical protein